MGQKIRKRSEKEVLRDYPIKSSVADWYFRITEIANNAYEVVGIDLYGKLLSRQGVNPDELFRLCEKDAQKLTNRAGKISKENG